MIQATPQVQHFAQQDVARRTVSHNYAIVYVQQGPPGQEAPLECVSYRGGMAGGHGERDRYDMASCLIRFGEN